MRVSRSMPSISNVGYLVLIDPFCHCEFTQENDLLIPEEAGHFLAPDTDLIQDSLATLSMVRAPHTRLGEASALLPSIVWIINNGVTHSASAF
jgi:hypothetical protein